uniref:FERM domain-containing protein n=2 Tax=Caenorhabditis japonica TaxID=281687 RepID=A0A8R1ELZ4_CAEJA
MKSYDFNRFFSVFTFFSVFHYCWPAKIIKRAPLNTRNAIGNELYEEVFYSLDLEERDYFGLQYTDQFNVQHWLDPTKKVAKQVAIGPPFTLRFRVKFFTSEPSSNLKEELTRYQFFLQIKQDIAAGRLQCPHPLAIELAALTLQSELGDYNPVEHTALFISEFRFHPEQDEKMEIEILDRYKACRIAKLIISVRKPIYFFIYRTVNVHEYGLWTVYAKNDWFFIVDIVG